MTTHPGKLVSTLASILLGSALGLAAGCTSAPVQEMSDARQAVQAAEASADPADQPMLAEARQLLAAAERALKEHRFKSAREAALEAHQLAVSVQKADAPERDEGHER